MSGERNRIDWAEAFSFWSSMPPGIRSFGKVARRFGVSDVAVGKAAQRYKWAAKVAELDRKAQAVVEKRVVRERSVRVADTLELIDKARRLLLEKLYAGEVEVDIGDFTQLARLEALLEGEPTDRVEVAEVRRVIETVFVVAGGFVPAGLRGEFLRAMQAATGERFALEPGGGGDDPS